MTSVNPNNQNPICCYCGKEVLSGNTNELTIKLGEVILAYNICFDCKIEATSQLITLCTNCLKINFHPADSLVIEETEDECLIFEKINQCNFQRLYCTNCNEYLDA